MKTKFNAYETTLYAFLNNIFVVCPNCRQRALVQSKGLGSVAEEKEVKLICTECGMNKYFSDLPQEKMTSQSHANKQICRPLLIGTNIDPYFRLPLWLQTAMPDGLLWAYNYEHLDCLENHVKASLRHRENSPMRNKSLGSRLPKWMTSKKNRKAVLRAIEKLKKK